jgi:hypothetical protein
MTLTPQGLVAVRSIVAAGVLIAVLLAGANGRRYLPQRRMERDRARWRTADAAFVDARGPTRRA